MGQVNEGEEEEEEEETGLIGHRHFFVSLIKIVFWFKS